MTSAAPLRAAERAPLPASSAQIPSLAGGGVCAPRKYKPRLVLTPEVIDRIRALAPLMSRRAVAAEIGASEAALHRWLKQYGINGLPDSDAKKYGNSRSARRAELLAARQAEASRRRDNLTADDARNLFNYDPSTGILSHRADRMRVKAGDPAGRRSRGAIYVGISQKNYAAHRLIWLIVHGVWPPELIDHVNGDPFDNRLENLRLATPSQNCFNTKRSSRNSSGVKGVYFSRQYRKWHARITVNGRTIHLGMFLHIEDAAAAYRSAAEKYHGQFARVA